MHGLPLPLVAMPNYTRQTFTIVPRSASKSIMPSPNRPSSRQRQASTELFLQALENEVAQRIRVEAASDAGREGLLRSTGIHDDVLLAELGKLGITADGLVALRLFPLVLVAWAEDNVDAKERAAVMDEATKLGITDGSTARILLHQWLAQKPPGLGVDAWRRYTKEIFKGMSAAGRGRLITLTHSQMTAVARASGGFLGLGKVSGKEQAIIHQVLTAMRTGGGSVDLARE